MAKKRLLSTVILLIGIMIFNAGCALLGAAASAGMAYGIYMATKK
jgi:hypothetical protein